MGLPDPHVQPDTDWRWVAHAAWGHAQLALNKISQIEEKLDAHTPDRAFIDDQGRRWEWCGGTEDTWAWRMVSR